MHAVPSRVDYRQRAAEVLERFGELLPAPREEEVAVRLTDGVSLADVVRGLDAEGVSVDDIELRAPTLDDVFLAKTGRSLEGAEEAPEETEPEEPVRAVVQR